jgi:uncharacterized FAD-dependent dehydrogenase
MKVKLSDVKVPYRTSDDGLKLVLAERLGIPAIHILDYRIIGQAVDARRKGNIQKSLSVMVETDMNVADKGFIPYESPVRTLCDLRLAQIKTEKRIWIAGSGPAGLFCALTLTKMGLKPIVLERGGDMEARDKAVGRLRKEGVLDTVTNVQFGEGGAGTYSDGKLNTGINDGLARVVLGEFAEHGAPAEIEVLNKPHIGTDYLKKVVLSMRNDIIEHGGEVRFFAKLQDIHVSNGRLAGVDISGEHDYREDCDILVLATGHSARDTFERMRLRGAAMERKPFSMGVRIEHLQKDVDFAQYGVVGGGFPPADYKHSMKLPDGRGVYTFCMCPGGEVVCAASEEGMLSTNGMSEFSRNKVNANSAILVSVTPDDFGGGMDPLAGVEFQRKYERLAYLAGGGGYKAPVQRFDDFAAGRLSAARGRIFPSYLPGTTYARLDECLPKYVSEGIKKGIRGFGQRMRGFDAGDALLTGIESRSSSPVRLLRNEEMQSNIAGLYPCGEGAGYAGGITSSAVDGIRTALAIYKILQKKGE